MHGALKASVFMAFFCSCASEVNISEPDGLRRVQVMTHLITGAADVSVCDRDPSRPGYPHTESVGTIHDDIADDGSGSCDCTSTVNGPCNQNNCGYGDNLDCGKTIEAPVGQTVTLTFTQMNLENGGGSYDCTCPEGGCDHVEVFDGNSPSSPSLGSFTGTDLPPPVVSTGNALYVSFKTDTGNCGISSADDPGCVVRFRCLSGAILSLITISASR
jgi:hypothetical protein